MTAAERAAEVIADVRFAWQRGDIADTVSRSEQAAQVAALMADPDLLVDLAIEAGGLVEDEAVEVFCDHVGGCREAGCDLTRKVFRRASRPTGEDRA